MKNASLLLIIAVFPFLACHKDKSPEYKPVTSGESVYYSLSLENHPPQPGLTLLSVSSYQQTTEYTCGPASVISLLGYYGRTGDEMTIASEMGTSTTTGTTPEQMSSWLNQHGFTAQWHQHGNLDTLRNRLARKLPTLVEWSDWGGPWVMVIGYDTRNTENLMDDVILFADPYDRTDDHPEGVTWFNAERFYYMWYDALLFGTTLRNVYIAAEPV